MNKRFFNSSDLSALLGQGSAAIFPTDTLPALATEPKFASQIFELKNRKPDKPLILMGACIEDLFGFAAPIAKNDALIMASKYWPGALTMVLPASSSSSYLVNFLNPHGRTIGLRVPNCSMARSLLSKSGPLATTSANLSGADPIFGTKELMECFPEIPFLGPSNWPNSSGLASSVIRWEGIGNWQLLREGAVIPEECEKDEK